MPVFTEGRPSGREWVIVATVALLASTAASLALGQDGNFDLLNYHLYNGFALLTGRLDHDLVPAGLATYFNPLLDGLHYLGISRLSPKAFAGLLGAIQGTNALLVWAVARSLMGPRGKWLAPVAALLGATGQNAVALLGTTFGDNTVSIPALAALLAVLGVERPGRTRMAVAGAFGGAAVGLKLTMAVPHLALTALACWLAWKQRRPALLIAFALGSAAGWGATNGWWAWVVWQRTANPFFPFFNGVFRSPLASLGPLRDARWRSGGAWLWLQPALDAALGDHERLQEVPLRDPRLLLVFVSLLAWLGCRLAKAGAARSATGRGLLLYWLAGYAAWLAVFHYYRYATVLEYLAPTVALLLLVDAWPRRRVIVASAVAATVLLATSVGQWREPQWSPTWFKPRVPALGTRANGMILLLDPGTSFVAPFFRRDAIFVGLASEWYGPALKEGIAQRVRDHAGPICALVGTSTPQQRDAVVRSLGFRSAGACEWARFGFARRYTLCPLERLGVETSQSADTLAAAAPPAPTGR
jgi:hypothetical protein